MKFLRITAILLFVFLLLLGFGYINTAVSYKYEVDLMTTHIELNKESPNKKKQELDRVEKRKETLLFQKKIISITGGLFLISFIIICYFIVTNKNKRNE